MDTMIHWSTCINVKNVESFFRLANFCRQFDKIAGLMTSLTEKKCYFSIEKRMSA